MSYNELVLNLFFNPQHAGISNDSHDYQLAQFKDTNQHQCIDFYVDLTSKGDIRAIRYLVKGNPFIIAGAEWMAQRVEKSQDAAILKDMTPTYWCELLAIPALDKRIAISLSQAAKTLYDLIHPL